MRRFVNAAIIAVVAAPPLLAQGALSLQGFGYPTGQLSARAAGTAGAIAETDAGSPLNPAALLNAGRTIFSFQASPEFRSVKVDGRTVNSTTARFPLITVGTTVLGKGFVGLSFATLLDRTWDAAYSDSVSVAGQRVRSSVSTSVRGAINDGRLAFAWRFSDKFQAGAGFHVLSGANHMRLARSFTDSAKFGRLSQSTTLSYAGTAVSGGVEALPLPHVIVAASLRLGGAMSTRYDDSLATRAHVPNRYSASLTYDGIPGSLIAVRYGREEWTRMRTLGTAALLVNDVTDLSAGLDLAGPKLQGLSSQVRFGVRARDLPFGWNGHVVKETSWAVGGQVPLARGWAAVDVGVERATRKAGGIRETGTILSVGLTVRP